MASLTRTDFLQEMAGEAINITLAKNDSRLSGLDLNAIDSNNSGFISGGSEMLQLFKSIDNFDSDGSYHSVDLGSSQSPTIAGKMIASIRELAKEQPSPHTNINIEFNDNALNSAFKSGFSGQIKRGDRGNKVVAIQYALGRLGHLDDLCDGGFGGLTEQAVKSFQQANNSQITGIIDSSMLKILDERLKLYSDSPPAVAPNVDPLTYLSDFRARGMPKIIIDRTSESNWSWSKAGIQEAYGQFVEHYWEVMKANQVEADCKTIALFFMDQFRKQLAEDTMIELPLPKARSSFSEQKWVVSTRLSPRGLFSRDDGPAQIKRSGYGAVKNVQALDPEHSMLRGVNIRYPHTSANMVSRSVKTVEPWNHSRSNRGDKSKPEISISKLKPGYLIFIDHAGDGRYDHTVNIVKIKKYSNGDVRQLVLAVGSYDDIKDNTSDTPVGGLKYLNHYAEEVIVGFNEQGRITDSKVTYSSEPSYLVRSRYKARNTLMEQRNNGTIKISRWS